MKVWFKVTALVTVILTVVTGVLISSGSMLTIFGNWTPIIIAIGLIWLALFGTYILSGTSDIEEED